MTEALPVDCSSEGISHMLWSRSGFIGRPCDIFSMDLLPCVMTATTPQWQNQGFSTKLVHPGVFFPSPPTHKSFFGVLESICLLSGVVPSTTTWQKLACWALSRCHWDPVKARERKTCFILYLCKVRFKLTDWTVSMHFKCFNRINCGWTCFLNPAGISFKQVCGVPEQVFHKQKPLAAPSPTYGTPAWWGRRSFSSLSDVPLWWL